MNSNSPKKESAPPSARKYWRIGTTAGENKYWETMRKRQYVSIGWPDIGDLAKESIQNREDIKKRLAKAEYCENAGVRSRKAGEIFNFFRNIKKGDIILAQEGQTVLGIGEVKGDYKYDDSEEFSHYRPVEWKIINPGLKNRNGLRTTVFEISESNVIRKIESCMKNPKNEPKVNRELNEILYGPPGTGKTYSTIRKAVELTEGTVVESASEHFKELRGEGRIEFITFHQSYCYEDFVEGIRPNQEDESDSIEFSCQPGIFKKLATRAAFECLEKISENPEAQHGEIPFFLLWESFLEKILSGEIIGLSIDKQIYSPEVTKKGNVACFYKNGRGKGRLYCGKKAIQEVYPQLRKKGNVDSGDVWRSLGRGGHVGVMAAAVNELKKLETDLRLRKKGRLDTDGQNTYEDMRNIVALFIKNGEESGFRLKPQSNWPAFVLVIDEINRGNMSKIFGELITLLEPDKRLGADNELSVRLPYSNEIFAVPGNLYLVGTMNTADKSIALVDVALRRRFRFEELSPDFSICSGLRADFRDLLNELNRRIMLRKGRDYRIGHAYFMDVKDDAMRFKEVMRYKIIPLLTEYFYNDWDGLRFVLGEVNGKSNGFIREISGPDDYGRKGCQWFYDVDDWDSFELIDVLRENFKKNN